MVTDAAYYLANMFSKGSFISNIDSKSLCMDEFEFEKNMESARALLSGLATDCDTQSNQGSLPGELPATRPRKPEKEQRSKAISDLNDCESISKVPSLSELENKGAAILLKEDEPNKTFQEYMYLFAQVGDLTVNDMEDLLNSYKQLALSIFAFPKDLA